MCFSATASFCASGLLALASLISFSQVRNRAEVTFATIPLLCAIQQAIEGLLWLTLKYNLPSFLQSLTTYLFLFFAYMVWPILVPVAVLLIEPLVPQKVALIATAVIGVMVSIFLFTNLLQYGAAAKLAGHHIYYTFRVAHHMLLVSFAYLLVTIMPFFISTIHNMWIIGITIGCAYLVSYFFYYTVMVSVWCFFAAILSILVIVVLRSHHQNKELNNGSWFRNRLD